jgi:hypothetical protein
MSAAAKQVWVPPPVAPMPYYRPGMPLAIGIYEGVCLLTVNDKPVAIPAEKLGRRTILAIYGGNEALLTRTWPRLRGRGWCHDRAAMAIIAACSATLISNPVPYGFAFVFPWTGRDGRPRMVGHAEWKELMARQRRRERPT